jgi:hypothetical protein
MEHNPYEAGAAIRPPADQGFARPRWLRVLAMVGSCKVAEALFEILLVAGTLGFILRINPGSIAHWKENRDIQVFLVQRLVALPAIALLSLGLARGLMELQPRVMRVQAILSAMVACWALLLSLQHWVDIAFAIEEFGAYPVIAARDIAFYVMRLCSGVVHFAIAAHLFHARRRLARGDAGVIADPSIKRSGCGSYLFASAGGFVLAYGTVGLTNSLVEVARRFLLRGIDV